MIAAYGRAKGRSMDSGEIQFGGVNSLVEIPELRRVCIRALKARGGRWVSLSGKDAGSEV